MNKREDFENWLIQKFGDSNGTKSSYLKVIDFLSTQLNKNVYEEFDEDSLKLLYQDLKQNQRNPLRKFLTADAPSYGVKGFYSATIKSYLVYLKK